MLVHYASVHIATGAIGVISDTHGLIRPEALAALHGVELIIHGGDIGKPQVLESLRAIAPTLAIRGNNDRESWAQEIPDILNLTVNGMLVQAIHNVNDLDVDGQAMELRAVISGHSHKPIVTERGGVLFINPGSAGPRRFKLPVAVARLRLGDSQLAAKIIKLDI